MGKADPATCHPAVSNEFDPVASSVLCALELCAARLAEWILNDQTLLDEHSVLHVLGPENRAV